MSWGFLMNRGRDCRHDAHDDVHFSGSDDQDLERNFVRTATSTTRR